MRNYFSVRTSQTVALELRRDMYRSVQRLSLENIDVLQPAGIITRITNDVTQIQEFINSMMRMMVKAPITCIGAVALIIMQTPRQAPVLIVILIIVGFLILGNVKIGYPRFGRVQKKLDALNAAAREFLSSVRVVKAFNAEEAEGKKFNAASGELAAANTSALHANALFNPLINLAVNMGIVVLLYISRSQNAGEIGKLMASVNYMTQVLFALTRIANVINVAVRAMASSARIQEVFDEKPAQPRAESPLSPEIRGNIKFDNVSFAYAISAKDSLSGISLTVREGETLGIIGPTGAGKTTLINLIPRFYDATEGAVYIDDCNVNSMDEHTLRAAVAVEFIIMDNFAQTVLFIFLFRLRLCRNHSFFGNRRLFLDLGCDCFLFVFCLYRRERGAARHKTGRDAGRHSHKGHRSFKAAVIQKNAVLRKRRDPAAKLAPADQRHVHLFSQAHFCAQRLFQNTHFPASFCSLPSVKKGNIFLYHHYNIRL